MEERSSAVFMGTSVAELSYSSFFSHDTSNTSTVGHGPRGAIYKDPGIRLPQPSPVAIHPSVEWVCRKSSRQESGPDYLLGRRGRPAATRSTAYRHQRSESRVRRDCHFPWRHNFELPGAAGEVSANCISWLADVRHLYLGLMPWTTDRPIRRGLCNTPIRTSM